MDERVLYRVWARPIIAFPPGAGIGSVSLPSVRVPPPRTRPDTGLGPPIALRCALDKAATVVSVLAPIVHIWDSV